MKWWLGLGEHPRASSQHFPFSSHSRAWSLQAFAVLSFLICPPLGGVQSFVHPVPTITQWLTVVGWGEGILVRQEGHVLVKHDGKEVCACGWLYMRGPLPLPAASDLSWKGQEHCPFLGGIVRSFSKCRPYQETPATNFYLRAHIWPATWFSFWFLCFLKVDLTSKIA